MRNNEGAAVTRRGRAARWPGECGLSAAAALGLCALGLAGCGASDSETVPTAKSDASSIVVYGNPYGDSGCDPTQAPEDEPCILADAYGVFVAPASSGGDDTGDGSMQHPFATFGKALSTARSNVFVCDGTYAENVTVTAPVRLYGGLSCETDGNVLVWAYAGGTATVSASSLASPALSVTDAGDAGVSIADLTFLGPDQPEQGWDLATGDGASSIAAFVAASAVTLTRVALGAGTGSDGAPGANGVAAPNFPLLVDGGADLAPNGTMVGYAFDGGPGALGGSNVCANGTASMGGMGGDVSASPPSGSAGSPGSPASSNPPDGTQNGSGGELVDSDDPSNLDGGCAGDPGADGLPAPGGNSAPVYGSLSASGWTPSPGGDGQPGGVGQGGGGGSGAAALLFGTLVPYPGCGGAAGGCGGAGGSGGRGGGASIALVSVDSAVLLTSCTLRAGQAGSGGSGGSGQAGQGGGNLTGAAGSASSNSDSVPCAGGGGGNGAGGSGGAGGTAGLSAGIVFTGAPPSYDTTTLIVPGLPGSPGPPGAGGPHGTNAGPLGMTTGSNGGGGAPGLDSAAVLVLGL